MMRRMSRVRRVAFVFIAACGARTPLLAPEDASIAIVEAGHDGTVFDPSTFARLPQGSGQSLTYKSLGGDVLQPGEVAILFLAHTDQQGSDGVACPKGIAPAITQFDPAVHGTGRGHAFHITSS